jgi:hypothetical protein
MIEIHYFKVRAAWDLAKSNSMQRACLNPCCAATPGLQGRVVRVYDFTFGFCIPNSVNTWEAIYDVPQHSFEEQMEYVSAVASSLHSRLLQTAVQLHTAAKCNEIHKAGAEQQSYPYVAAGLLALRTQVRQLLLCR